MNYFEGRDALVPSVFIFPCESPRNISLGIQAGLWAIPIQQNKPSVAGKARSMDVGDYVLLYLSKKKLFYGMFRVTSTPDEDRIVSDVWEGRYELPFEIEPCPGQGRAAAIDASTLVQTVFPNAPGPWTKHITRFRGLTYFCPEQWSDAQTERLKAKFIAVSNGAAAL